MGNKYVTDKQLKIRTEVVYDQELYRQYKNAVRNKLSQLKE